MDSERIFITSERNEILSEVTSRKWSRTEICEKEISFLINPIGKLLHRLWAIEARTVERSWNLLTFWSAWALEMH